MSTPPFGIPQTLAVPLDREMSLTVLVGVGLSKMSSNADVENVLFLPETFIFEVLF